jgi:hypothetical protein
MLRALMARLRTAALATSMALAVVLPSAATSDAPLLEITRIYTGEDGLTRFGESAIVLSVSDYAPPAPAIAVSPRLPATDIAIARIPSGWFGDWHPAPRRQYALMLTGTFEIETGDGATRRFPPGSLFLLEDTSGQGHRSRVIGDDVVTVALVPTPERVPAALP